MATLIYLHNRYKYKNEDALDNVINYVTHSHDGMKLISNGSADLILDPHVLYNQLVGIQTIYRNDTNLGKKAIHAVINFTKEELAELSKCKGKLLLICNMLSNYYHSIGHQNLFAIFERPDNSLQVDFMINSVNWISGRKLICSNQLTEQHEDILNSYLDMWLWNNN